MRTRGRSKHALLPAMVVATLVLGGCFAGESSQSSDPDNLIIDVEPTVYQFIDQESANLAGTSTSPDKIQPGDCFNEYLYRDRTDLLQQVTTKVSCDTPHDREAFARTQHPAGEDEPFPLNDELTRWAEAYCLDEFSDFVGLDYVLSLLEIGTVLPEFDAWTEDGYRDITCYVYPANGGRLRESVERRGI